MNMNVGSIGAACTGAMQNQGIGARRGGATDVSKLVEQAFSKIDSKQQGYIDEAELESALGKVSGAGSGDASTIMQALDGDSDGKVTKDELADGLRRLADQLESQFNEMRARHGHTEGYMPSSPPGGGHVPPSGETKAGLSKDDLTAMVQGVDSESKAASDLNSLLASFDKADTDADGKVSLNEAQAFRRSQQAASGSSADEIHSHRERSAEAAVMGTIMRLVASYGASENTPQQSNVTVTA